LEGKKYNLGAEFRSQTESQDDEQILQHHDWVYEKNSLKKWLQFQIISKSPLCIILRCILNVAVQDC
jgi:hypothetical protein